MPDERIAAVGRETETGLYYEVLGRGNHERPSLLFIHGGGGTGVTWRASFDGRPGWADLLAEAGYEAWVTDWPGAGRSGYRDLLTLDYADVVDGYLRLVRDVIRRPVIVLPHSMGGAITWRLIEEIPDLIAGVVGIAASYPANIQQEPQITKDDGRVVELTFADTGVDFVVDRMSPYTYGDDYIYKQAISGSTHFDMAWIPALKSSLGAISPRMLLQRVGAVEGMPTIQDPSGFAGKRVRLIAGDQDPAHTLAIEQRTADCLNGWGADAQVVWLPDAGIHGSSHFLPNERNYEEVLDVVRVQLRAIHG